MRFSSKTLTKINFTIFSCLFLGSCAYHPKYFTNEYLEPTRVAVINEENQVTMKMFSDQVANNKFLQENPKIFYLMLSAKKGGKTVYRDFLAEYSEVSRRYFSTQKLSIPSDFREEIFKKAEELYQKGDNILFYLATYIIDLIHIIENNQFLDNASKESQARAVIQAYYDSVNVMVKKALGIPNAKKSPTNIEVFSYEEVLSTDEDVYTMLFSIPNISFRILKGPISMVLEYCIIMGINRQNNKKITNIEGYFEALQYEIDSTERARGLYAIFDNFKNYLASFLAQLQGPINSKFAPLYSFRNLEDGLEKKKVSWNEYMRCLEGMSEKMEYLVDFSEVFQIKAGVWTVLFQKNQKLFRVDETRENGDPEGKITAAEMQYHVGEYLEVKKGEEQGKNGKVEALKEKFEEADEMLATITGCGQTFALEFVRDCCEDIFSKFGYSASKVRPRESRNWDNTKLFTKDEFSNVINKMLVGSENFD